MTFQVRVENEGGKRNWIITGHFSFPIPRFFFFERASVESKTCEAGSLVDAGKRFLFPAIQELRVSQPIDHTNTCT